MTINLDLINSAFNTLISERGVHEKLKLTSVQVRQLRSRIKNANSSSPVSTDMKLKLLQKSGWRQDQGKYTQQDMVAAVKFALRQGAAAKEQGAEYLVEKFLKKR